MGPGSNPATVPALIALLVICGLNYCGQKLKEVSMKNQRKKSRKSKSKACTVKRRITYLAMPVACIFDVVWAIGASTVAAMASPLLLH